MEERDFIFQVISSSAKYPEVKRTAEDRERWRAINGREIS